MKHSILITVISLLCLGAAIAETEVTIDIKPNSYPNTINLGSHGVLAVAFMTDETFDASTIDPLTITLRGEDFDYGLVKLRGNGKPMASIVDVDGDGDLDLLVRIDTEKLSEDDVDVFLELIAMTYSGAVIRGVDFIRVVPEGGEEVLDVDVAHPLGQHIVRRGHCNHLRDEPVAACEE